MCTNEYLLPLLLVVYSIDLKTPIDFEVAHISSKSAITTTKPPLLWTQLIFPGFRNFFLQTFTI